MSSFTRAGVAILVVLALHALATGFYWYEYYPWFDILMHFSGGCAVGMLMLAAWNAYIGSLTFRKVVSPFWQGIVITMLILGLVAFVGVIWEWYEFLFDRLIVVAYPGMLPAQTSLGDTMADLALDLLGGLVALLFDRIGQRHR